MSKSYLRAPEFSVNPEQSASAGSRCSAGSESCSLLELRGELASHAAAAARLRQVGVTAATHAAHCTQHR